MSLPQDTLTISEFEQDNARLFASMNATKRPVVLTEDGKARFVVMDADAYLKLESQALRLETVEAIKEGLADMEAGRGEEAHVVFAELERTYPFLK